jgi:hypothetical protein
MRVGFADPDIHALAARLSAALGVALQRVASPMIGPWYTDFMPSPAQIQAAVACGRADFPRSLYALESADSEYAYGVPVARGPIACVLTIDAGGADLEAIVARLREAGLAFVEMDRL